MLVKLGASSDSAQRLEATHRVASAHKSPLVSRQYRCALKPACQVPVWPTRVPQPECPCGFTRCPRTGRTVGEGLSTPTRWGVGLLGHTVARTGVRPACLVLDGHKERSPVGRLAPTHHAAERPRFHRRGGEETHRGKGRAISVPPEDLARGWHALPADGGRAHGRGRHPPCPRGTPLPEGGAQSGTK